VVGSAQVGVAGGVVDVKETAVVLPNLILEGRDLHGSNVRVGVASVIIVGAVDVGGEIGDRLQRLAAGIGRHRRGLWEHRMVQIRPARALRALIVGRRLEVGVARLLATKSRKNTRQLTAWSSAVPRSRTRAMAKL
jgi:hypothetical protein